MKNSRLLLLGLLFLTKLSIIKAQTDCSALLSHGVFDYSKEIGSQENVKRVLSYLDRRKYKSASSLRNDAMGVSIGLPKIGNLGLNSSGGVSYNGSEYSSFTKLYQDNSSFRSNFNKEASTASTAILNAFNECMARTQGNNYKIWAMHDLDYSRVIVSIQRTRYDPLVQTLKIKAIVSPDATPITSYVGRAIGNDPLNLTFKVNENSSDLMTFEVVTDDTTGSYNPHVAIQKVIEDTLDSDQPTVLSTKLLIKTKTKKHKDGNTCEEIWIYFGDLTAGWKLRLPTAPGGSENTIIDAGVPLGDIQKVKISLRNMSSCDGVNNWMCEFLTIENLRTSKVVKKVFENITLKQGQNSSMATNIIWE